MNLWTKAVILLLVFNGFEYSMAASEDGCEESGETKVANMINSCFLFGAVVRGSESTTPSNGIDLVLSCCLTYYTLCLNFETIRKYCKPNNEFNEDYRKQFTTIKCKPSKDLCDKYLKDISKNCEEYKYSECEAYTWNPSLSDSPKEVPTPVGGTLRPVGGTSPPEKDKPTTSGAFSSLSALNALVICLSVFPFILIIA